jgi:hypothetical protein
MDIYSIYQAVCYDKRCRIPWEAKLATCWVPGIAITLPLPGKVFIQLRRSSADTAQVPNDVAIVVLNNPHIPARITDANAWLLVWLVVIQEKVPARLAEECSTSDDLAETPIPLRHIRSLRRYG